MREPSPDSGGGSGLDPATYVLHRDEVAAFGTPDLKGAHDILSWLSKTANCLRERTSRQKRASFASCDRMHLIAYRRPPLCRLRPDKLRPYLHGR